MTEQKTTDEVSYNKAEIIRGLLNEMPLNTFEKLVNYFFGMEIDINAIGVEIVDFMFDRVVQEPQLCPTYSELCCQIVVRELEIGGDNKSKFRNILLLRCQKVFEDESEEVKKQKQKAIDECQDETEKHRLKDEWAEYIEKGRARIFGNILFIGELFKKQIIISSIIHYCVMTLIQKTQSEEGDKKESTIDQDSIECIVKLLKSVGSLLHADKSITRYNERCCDMLNKCCSWLVEDHRDMVGDRVKLAIDDLLELQKNDWVPRKEAKRPKKFDEIRQQAKKEKIEENIRNKAEIIRGLLNEMPLNSFEKLVNYFFGMEIDVNAIGVEIVDFMFDRVVQKPQLCTPYSELCCQIVVREFEIGGDNKSKLRNILLLRCQKVFEDESEEVKKQKQNAIDESQDETEKHRLKDEWAEHIENGRARSFGNILFIGELFKKKILISSIIHYCVMTLIQKTQSEDGDKKKSTIDQDYIECIVKLLKSVGSLLHADKSTTRYNERCCDMLIKYCSWLEDHREMVGDRVKLAIDEMLGLQKIDWVPANIPNTV